jgi:hypothetical protein
MKQQPQQQAENDMTTVTERASSNLFVYFQVGGNITELVQEATN